MKIRSVSAAGLLFAAGWFLTGCEDRSISDSGYRGNSYARGSSPSFRYRGELLEADVVGASPTGGAVTEADIQKALGSSRAIHAEPGTGLVVVQSGAANPDTDMLAALGAHYRVQSFSGLPPGEDERAAYSRSVRLEAASSTSSVTGAGWSPRARIR